MGAPLLAFVSMLLILGCGDDGAVFPPSPSGWSPFGSDLRDSVADVIEFDSELIVGGAFRAVGGLPSSGVSVLDGDDWSTLPAPVPVSFTTATQHRDRLVVGTTGVASGFLLSWNGRHWEPFQGGTDGSVSFVRSLGEQLIVHGDFRIVGGDTLARQVALWDGQRWSGLDRNGVNGPIVDAAFYDGDLYFAGSFTRAGLVRAPGIVRWDGDSFLSLGETLVTGWVEAIEVHAGELYVAGNLWIDDRIRTLARWDGEEWRPLLDQVDGRIVRSLLAVDGQLIAAGRTDPVEGGAGRPFFATVDGEVVTEFGPELTGLGGASHLVELGGSLYASGDFGLAAEPSFFRLIRWGGTEWDRVLGAPADPIHSLVVAGDRLVVVSEPTRIGSRDVPGVARWADGTWVPMGQGLNGSVGGLRIFGDELYAFGQFFRSGPRAVDYFARWDGESWQQFGPAWDQVVHTVRDLWVDDDGAYAVGNRGLQRLQGDGWEVLDGFPALVAITRFQGGIVVGQDSPGVKSGVYSLVGDSLEPLAGGLPITCRALLSHQGSLYAGGSAFGDGSFLAVSDGESWRDVASTWRGSVREIRVVRDEVVALGQFSPNGFDFHPIVRIVGDTIQPYSADALKGQVQTMIDWRGRDVVGGELELPGEEFVVPLAIR